LIILHFDNVPTFFFFFEDFIGVVLEISEMLL